MKDPRLERLARTLVDYSVKVKPGDWVVIRTHVLALPLAAEVVRNVLRAGGNPNWMLDSELLDEATLVAGTTEQMEWVSPLERDVLERADVLINLRAAANARALTGVDPAKMRARQAARRDLMQTYMRRSAEGSLRWTIALFPCDAFAQEADMSLADYEDFVYSACYADKPDPVAEWKRVEAEQQRLVDWLRGKKQVEVRGPNAELTLSIDGRKFINSSATHNMPSGEIFTGPVEDSANGWVRFTYPAITQGREVEGVRLEFRDGKVVNATAVKNEEFLLSMLDTDEGARYLGEFAVGTNYGIQRFTKNILFDEKIGGSLHMAVGSGYPETGSQNKSAIHWDFICDMRQDSEIVVDGELMYRNGQFQV